MRLSAGTFSRLGASWDGRGTNFALFSANAQKVELCLFDAPDAAHGFYDLARRLGVQSSLRDIGMPEAGIEDAADLAVTSSYWNPRRLERNAIRDLIARAWSGEPPAATSF